jgi:hypothetical protein
MKTQDLFTKQTYRKKTMASWVEFFWQWSVQTHLLRGGFWIS